jgi:tight adherence protein B
VKGNKMPKVGSLRNIKVLFAVVLAAFISVAGIPPVAADTQSPTFSFQYIDSSSEGTVSGVFVWSGSEEEAKRAEVYLNGEKVDADISKKSLSSPQAISFVIDVSQVSEQSGALAETKVWLLNWLNSRSEEQQRNQPIAIYAAGARPEILLDFSTNRERQISSIEKLNSIIGKTPSDPNNSRIAIWEAIETASKRIKDFKSPQKSVVVITVGGNSSSSRESEAVGRMKESEAAFFAVVGPQATSGARFDELASSTGGATSSALEKNDIDNSLKDTLSTITDSQYSILVSADQSDSSYALSLKIGDRTISGSVTKGSSLSGASSIQVNTIEPPDPNFLSNPIFLGIAFLLLAGAIIFVAYFFLSNVVSTSSMSEQVAIYTRTQTDGVDEKESEKRQVIKNILVQKAIDTTERIAEQRNLSGRVEIALERADISLKPAEFLFLYFMLIPIASIVGLYVGGPLFLLVFATLAAVVPPALLSRLAERRRKKFLEQLPDTLHLVAGSLRAGYSLPQGLDAASEETGNPIAQELRRASNETRLGADMIESLDKVALRMNSQDFSWAVMGISIQREVGGDLSELLDTIAETMVQRERLRRDIRTLTAEGRVSALILLMLPFGLMGALFFLNRDYISILFTTGMGRLLLMVGAIGLGIGWYLMKKIVTIKV